MGAVRRQVWEWRFRQPPAAVWTMLADTARFNEAAGLPKHAIEEIAQADGSVRWTARLRRGPFVLEWEEQPVNWVSGQWFEHCRHFRSGPFRSLCASLALEPEGEGARGLYTVAVEPANPLGRLILAGGFFRNARRKFGRLAATADAYLAGERATPFDYAPPALPPAALRRARALAAEIEATPHGHGLAGRLVELVLTAQEVDLWHIRPLALARAWNAPPRHVVELCLQAVRSGLLELRWDLLCPRCRVAKDWTPSLDRLPTGAHCGSCNIDYERSFSQNVEATFRPAAAIRPVAGGDFCLFGPMTTPHIRLHVTVAPGATRTLPARLAFGPYRLRTLEPGEETTVDWTAGGFPELVVARDSVRAGAPAPAGMVRLTNRDDRPRTLIVEDRAWLRDVLTADRITALQAFRDLFAGEVLRPGDEVGIAQVTLMFTDLKGSTALYERIGDARAYQVVRAHFAFLAERIRAADGAIVKTIGDAVMAAFADPADGVRAALAIQREVARFNAREGSEQIAIKLGLHKGPCIAVTLNDRLDYFGTTVNLAARLQQQSEGGDIVLSADLLADAAAAAALGSCPLAAETSRIKGFDRPVPFYRLRPPADRAA